MSNFSDALPAFAAPFVSSPMQVEPQWIDYNGHLNMAYYNVLLDRCVDEVFELLGCGLAYVKERRQSWYTAEVHLRYLRELHANDPVKVTFQLLEYDAKRMHYFEHLLHAEEGWVSATSATHPLGKKDESLPKSSRSGPRTASACCMTAQRVTAGKYLTQLFELDVSKHTFEQRSASISASRKNPAPK